MNTRTIYDVLVVGEGFSGLCAAIFAARSGKRTLILTRGAGVLAIGGGTIDVLGTDTNGHTLLSPFDGFASLPSRHPYSLLGEQTVRNALTAFSEICHESHYEHFHSEKNIRLVTALGTTKPSFVVPRTLSMRGIEEAETVYVAGVEGLKDFSPKLVTEGLSGRNLCFGKKLVPITLSSPFRLQRDLGTLDLARYLDSREGIHWLIHELNSALDANSSKETTTVLIPPILGTKPNYAAHEAVEKGLETRVHETVALAPAVTGLRLYTMLTSLLRKYGVDVIEQAEVTGSVVNNGRCEALLTCSGGRERRYAAKSFIIATGGVLGEGFQTTPDRAWETIFNLDLPLAPCSPEWSQPELFPAAPLRHGFALLGPNVDKNLHPLATDGSPLCSNVFFVGKTLGGYDHATEKSGNGVALATAWHAAHYA